MSAVAPETDIERAARRKKMAVNPSSKEVSVREVLLQIVDRIDNGDLAEFDRAIVLLAELSDRDEPPTSIVNDWVLETYVANVTSDECIVMANEFIERRRNELNQE